MSGRSPIKLLRALLSYDPRTGDLLWKVDRHGGPGNKLIKAGSIAGTISKNGYRYVNIEHVPQLAHRIAWALTHGRWPQHQIDHINMVRLDNRMCNLREATNSENSRNRRAQSNNVSSGIKGVTRTRSGYFARIAANGVTHYLGHFRTREAARAAYTSAAEKHHSNFKRVT